LALVADRLGLIAAACIAIPVIIRIIIGRFAFAIVEADALSADGDAFLTGNCRRRRAGDDGARDQQ
jgi:hypothetical protein